jgi:hypothetical protein
MQPREKLLAIGLAATLGVWQGSRLLDSLVTRPLAENRSNIGALQEKVMEKETELAKQKRAAKTLAEWNLRSLPPDPAVASSLYQNWLIELATKGGLSEPVVTPGRFDAKPKDWTYYVIPATVKGKGTLSQVAGWLYEFYAAGLLQRVKSVAVASESKEGNPLLDVTILVEGMSLVGAPSRTTLFATGKPTQPLVELPSREELPSLTGKNLFVRGYNGPPPPPAPPAPVRPTEPPPPPRDTFDAAAYVYLVAVISTDGQPEAWLYDRGTNTQTTLTAGKAFKVAGVEGSVTGFGKDWIEVDVGGAKRRLDLGRPLKDLSGGSPAAGG